MKTIKITLEADINENSLEVLGLSLDDVKKNIVDDLNDEYDELTLFADIDYSKGSPNGDCTAYYSDYHIFHDTKIVSIE